MTEKNSTPETPRKPNQFMYWICGWQEIEDSHGNTKWVILFMEKHTRYVLECGIYDQPTVGNTLEALTHLISQIGIPCGIITNGKPPFTTSPNPLETDNLFTRCLADAHILHLPLPDIAKRITPFWKDCRKYNHKFKSFESYSRWYNEERPHAALHNTTPKEAFHKYLITELWDGKEPEIPDKLK